MRKAFFSSPMLLQRLNNICYVCSWLHCNIVNLSELSNTVHHDYFSTISILQFSKFINFNFDIEMYMTVLQDLATALGQYQTTVRPRLSGPLLSGSLAIRKKIVGYRFSAYAMHTYSMCVRLSGSLAYPDIFVENGCVRLTVLSKNGCPKFYFVIRLELSKCSAAYCYRNTKYVTLAMICF